MSNPSLLKFAVFFSIISFTLCTTTALILKKRLGLTSRQNFWMLLVFAGVAILMIVGPLVFRYWHANIAGSGQNALQFAQYFLMGWTAMLFLTFVTLEVIQALVHIISIPFQGDKRIFLTEGVARGVATTVSALVVGGLVQARQKPKVEKVEVLLKNLPRSFDGFTMAQISDVHIGPLLHSPFLSEVVDQVLSLNADVILITGDLVDGTVEQLREQVEPLRRLKAKDGVYFCTGNHEYYSGAEEWIAHLESMGIHVFKNSNVILGRGIEKIALGGVYDWQGGRFYPNHSHDPYKAIVTSEPVSCTVLMAHNPFSIVDAAKAGWNYQVSGHTHAGQFYPFAWIVKLALKHSEGHYTINEHTQLYVNRGTGFWGPPNRLGKPSEITLHTLKTSS